MVQFRHGPSVRQRDSAAAANAQYLTCSTQLEAPNIRHTVSETMTEQCSAAAITQATDLLQTTLEATRTMRRVFKAMGGLCSLAVSKKPYSDLMIRTTSAASERLLTMAKPP